MPKPGKSDVDPEELMRRKFRAKCLFRALGRQVMANAYWLIEGVDHYEGLEDVKRRVEQAVRGKKKKQLLTIDDKALLNKPADQRTDQEKQYLYRILGGLKCFKRYPNNVKRKLAALTYFKYYSPGRAIVRQHQEAHAMYFIVTGDIIVSQMIFDELLQQYVSVDVGVMHPGDMFGEVSLLHSIPRTATVTTSGHCELLALMKEDFKNVLQASVQKQWDEVRKAMSAFNYFDSLDPVALREGCIVAKMKSYTEKETLLGDGAGIANFVYFVISGQCQMIESIQVIVKTHLGKEFYTLYDPCIPSIESEEDFESKYFGKKKLPESSDSSAPRLERTAAASYVEPSSSSSIKNNKSSILTKNVSIQNKESRRTSLASETEEILLPKEAVDERRQSVRISLVPEAKKPVVTRPPNLRTYFMQVCLFNPGSSFGFGENMRNRRIVALTNVECLLLPKMWLLQRNTANIWTRIQYYLEKKIPTTKHLFKEFVSSRRWQSYKDQLVEDVVSKSKAVNYTTIHDVPYSIRMDEMLDI